MGKKGKNTTTYQERPQSAQELKLLETQNQMTQAGIGIAREQEDRSQAQYDQWKDTYLPLETGAMAAGANRGNGYQAGMQADPRASLFRQQLDNQMPRYAEDTSGVYGKQIPQVAYAPQQKRNGKGA